jgi:hypothetical protein
MKLLKEYDNEYLRKLEYLRFILKKLSDDVVMGEKSAQAANNLVERIFLFIEKNETDSESLKPHVEKLIQSYLLDILKEVEQKIEKYGDN